MSFLEGLLNRIPGSRNTREFLGTAGIMGFLALTFFGGKTSKSGHNLMDVGKPESGQTLQESAEEARLSRFARGRSKATGVGDVAGGGGSAAAR